MLLPHPAGIPTAYVGTVDARNLKGNQSCMSGGPFDGLAIAGLRLLLGPVTISASKLWTVPPNVTIEGVGAGVKPTGTSPGDAPSTVIYAVGTMSAVVVLGSAPTSGSANIHLQDLSIDCNQTAPIGIQNDTIGEGTTMERIRMRNCSDTGLEVATSGAVNSGPYRDLYVTPGKAAVIGATTTCVRVGVPAPGATACGPGSSKACYVAGWKGIQGLTCDASCSGTGCNTSSVAVDVTTQGGEISDVHIERWLTGVRVNYGPTVVSGTNSTRGLVLRNIHGCSLDGTMVACSAPAQLGALIEFEQNPNEKSFGVVMTGLQIESDGTKDTCAVRYVNPGHSTLYYNDLSVALFALSVINDTSNIEGMPLLNTNQTTGTLCN